MTSNAFKKRMKGRCGCGGSHHNRAFITCADQTDCGPCGLAGGCNIGGSQIWFCNPPPENLGILASCFCINTIFHEIAHACGKAHNLQYILDALAGNPQCNDTDQACIIGDSFSGGACVGQ